MHTYCKRDVIPHLRPLIHMLSILLRSSSKRTCSKSPRMESKGHCGLLYHHGSVLTSSCEAMGSSTLDRTPGSSRLAQGCADLAPLLSVRWVPCCINYQALLGRRRISSILHLHVSRTRSTTETASTSAATMGAKIPPSRHRWALHCWLPVARITLWTWDCHRGCSALLLLLLRLVRTL